MEESAAVGKDIVPPVRSSPIQLSFAKQKHKTEKRLPLFAQAMEEISPEATAASEKALLLKEANSYKLKGEALAEQGKFEESFVNLTQAVLRCEYYDLVDKGSSPSSPSRVVTTFGSVSETEASTSSIKATEDALPDLSSRIHEELSQVISSLGFKSFSFRYCLN